MSKRLRVTIIAVLGLGLLFSASTLRLFVFPDLNAPVPSNAIVVLGEAGGAQDETAEGVKLAEEGYAPTIAFSSDSCSTSSIPHRPTEHVLCFGPRPTSTQGEARWIGQMAKRHHWQKVIVVMRTPQATRARIRIGRCYPGMLLEVGVTPQGFGGWLYEIVYEWGALMKALVLQPSC
jgi:hypothetical protein